MVGQDLFKMIENIFTNPENVKEVNETLITLIPKVDQVTRIRDFRPISLCNVSYKVITKILALRLRAMMEKLVNTC